MAVGDAVDGSVEQLINSASALGSTTIDLSKKRLTQVPPDVLNLQQLEVNLMAISNLSSLTARLLIVFHNFHNIIVYRNRRKKHIPPCKFILLCFAFSVFVFGGKFYFVVTRGAVRLPTKLTVA